MVKILNKILYLGEEGDNSDRNIFLNNVIRAKIRDFQTKLEEIVSKDSFIIIPLHGFVLLHEGNLTVENFYIDKKEIASNVGETKSILDVLENHTVFSTYNFEFL